VRILLQRVTHASVEVEGEVVAAIHNGIVALVGFKKGDSRAHLAEMASKLLHLRIFPDDRERLHFSLLDSKGELLLVPQFTLYGDTSKGRRPDFFNALEPQLAKELFEEFVEECRKLNPSKLGTGVFQAHMKVSLLNDGPVTLMLESPAAL
jgi:D-tyrosyl-tRNA(Tyr) deacylase